MSIVDDFKKRRDSGFVNDASSSLGKGNETYAERKSRLKKAKVNFGVDDEYLKSYENDYNSYRDKVSSTGETNQEDWYDLNQKQRYLKAYLNSNSKNMEYEDYNNFNNFLNDTDTSSRNLYRLAEQATAEKTKKKRIDFGQEKETLNTDTANRLEEMARQMRMAGADEATIDKAVYGKDGWESANKPRTYEAQYGDFTHTDDYYNNKDYRTSKTGEGKRDLLSGYYFDTGYKDIEHDIINGDANARLIYDANYGDNPSMENTYLDRLDAEEKAKYNYLYNTKGKEEAMKYIDTIKKDLMSRQGAKEAEYWQNEADKDYGNDIANGANGIALSALNVLLGMAKPLETVGQGLDYLQSKITGEGGINEYKPQNFRATNISNAITSTIGEKWDNAVQNGMKQAYINDIRANGGSEADVQYALDNYDENTGKGVGNFAYQTAMSMANFLSTALVTGNFASGLSDIEKKIAENLSLAIMGAGATADTVIEAKQRGADDDQAFVMGAIAGIAEIVTEKFSLEALLDTSLYKSSEIKYILKNTLAEGSEEVASDLINTVADIIIMSDKSELQTRMQELVSEGKSESEAFGIAIAEFGKDLGLSFLGGALSGGILGVGGAYVQGRNVNNLIQTYGDDLTSNEITNTVLGEGLSSAEGSDARTNALALERMIGDGKTLSNEDVARQMMLNLQQNSSDMSLTDEEVRELENAVREELTGIKNEEENKIASNPLIDANTEQAKVEEFANNFEYKPAQAVISSMYGGNMSAVEYNKLANDAYMAGYKGEAIDTVDTNNRLTNAQKSAIYEVGQMSRKQDNRYESELQLSEGEQWNDSKNTRVITNELEVNPSEDKRWNYSKKRSAKDGESASLIRGKTVKVKDLIGIESKGEVTLIEEGYDTKYTAKARQIAKDNGLKLQLVSGLISVTESDGTESLNRGLIKGDTMYVQVDHANFTADQLVAHEVTHPKIDNGEIDTKATMKKAKKVLGKKKFNQAVRAYAQAYMGMNAEVDEKAFNYYFNEIICDAVAGMNAFEQIDNRVLISSHAPVVDAVAKSVVYDANKANAPPSNNEVKMSQEMASNGVVLSEEQSDFFANSKIRDAEGRLLVMHHGTARADRVGNVFRSDRATSGPMAFFTSDPQIAENYSKDKNDTSLDYDEDYDMYETQFKVKTDRFDRPLYKLWSEIPFSKKQDIKKKAGELREDWDSGDGSFVLVEGNTSANGGFEWQLKESNGNVIKALIEQWLNSGTLFNEEERFLKVLEKTGITQAIKDKYGVEPYYKDKNFRDEKVYSVFLNIANPFVAYEQVNEKFVDEFEKWANEHYDEYEEKVAYSDMWDKNNVSAEDFADRMRNDIENNTTHAWTSIPDIATDYLKTLGYDGIVDNGGKFHNAEHQVVIPFYSNQIKNTDNLNPTSSEDIRFSQEIDAEKFKKRLSPSEFAQYTERIGGIKRGNIEHKSIDGSAVFEIGNKVIVTNPDYYDPKLSRVYELDDINETSMATAKEFIYYGEKNGISIERTRQAIERIYPEGYVNIYDIRDYERNGRKESSGSGENGKRIKRGVSLLNTDNIWEARKSQEMDSTSNPSIKHSQEITNPDLKALQKENRELEKRLEKTAEQVVRWKSELKVDHTLRVQKSDINRITDKLLQEYSAGTDKKALKQKLTDLANYVLNNNSDENYVDTVKNMAIDIASDIINDAKVLDEGGYSDVYNDLKMMLTTGNGMKLSSRDIADIPDFKDFKKQDFGKLKITESGRDVDSTYEELMEMYPELFSEDVTHPADRLMEMVDVVNKIAPRMENPFDMYLIDMAEITETLANEIVDMAINGEMKATLPNFATRQENKLNEQKAKTEKAKEQVKEMRDKKNAEIEEVKSQARQKMEKLRQKRSDDIRKLKEGFADKQYRDREKRNAQELRKKIEKKVKDLNQKLLNPTDKKHIPQDFRGVVAKLLESINMTSPKDNDPDTIRLASLRTEAFRDLQKAYEKVMKEGEYVIDDDMLGTDGILEQIIEWGNEPIMEMSAYKLGIIYNTIRSLEHSISTYNRLLSEENGRTIHMYSEGLMNDNESVKAKTEWNGRLGGVVNRMSLGMLTPQAFFHKLGKYGDMLFKKMRQAQDKYISILKTASDFTNNNIKGIDVNKLSEQTREVVLGGRNVELSVAQLMELYVLANREQGLKHILTGGIVPDAVKNKGVKANRTLYAIKGITQDELTRAFTKLTPEQITIADKLQEFLSKDMSRFGNEATMKVYGYEKFNEEKYWHINVYELHMKDKGDNGQVKPTTVAGKGMAKNTIPNANVAIRVGDIFNSFAKHVVDMAEYSAWLATMADINRIRNYKTKDGDNIRSVKETINKVHGEGGYKYLAKLLTDLSNGVASEQEYFGGLLGNMKASAVGTNLRVILQQPTAIYRALSLIDAKYLLPKANPVSAFKGWEKAVKYSPIAQWKDWGYFDINTGRAIKDVLFNNTSKMAKAKEIAMKAAGMADSYAWGMLWNAVESETKATTDLKVGSEEYYNHCAERFSDIIDQTQVVDGVLQRSEMMRSTNGMDKMATAFMGEPTKQYNQFLNAVNDVRRGNKDAKNKMFKTVVAMASAGVLNACVQSIVDAMRHSDRDKNYWEQWLEEMIGITGDEEKFEDYMKNIWSSNLFNVVDVAGYIPYVKDFESILQGYTVERMDMSAVSDAVKSANNFMKVLKGESKLSFANALTDFAFQIGNVFGVSAYNLKRDILGLTSTVINSSGNLEASYELQKTLYNITNTNTRSIFIGYLYEAYKTDKNLYNKILKELQKTYTNDQIQTSMRNLQKKEAGVTKLSDLKEAPYTLK